MANPSVTALISAVDNASPVLDRLLAHSKQVSASMAADASRIGQAHVASIDTLSARLGTFRRELDAATAGAFAGFGTHFIREALAVDSEMARIERRTAAFTTFTKQQMAEIREASETTLSGGPGGPQGAFDAARALGMSGVRGDEVRAILPFVAMHADETGESQEHSAESLVGITQMLGLVVDQQGKSISIQNATAAQAAEGVRKAESYLITANQIAPGSLRDLVEGLKFAAPTSGGLGRDPAELFALYTALAEKGIRGAEAGNTIRSVESRLASPTAKARAAISTGGLNLSDYVAFDPNKIDEDGIEKGLTQRLGSATHKIHDGLQAAIDKFKAGGSAEDFQTTLTDLITSSGVKSVQNRVVAANLARDTLADFVSSVDLPKFLADAAAKGLGVGFLNSVFGKEQGSRMAALLGDHVEQLKTQFDNELKVDRTGKAAEERAQSYDGRLAELTGALTGLKARLAEPAEPILGEGYHQLASLIKDASGASEPIRDVLSAIVAGGTAIGGLKVAGTFATLAGGIQKVLLGAEEAGPIVSVLGGLASIEFGPAVIGIGLLTAGIEAFIHRAEIAHQLDLSNRNDFDVPTSADEAASLRARRDDDLRQLADRQRATLDDALQHDDILADLNNRRLERLSELRVSLGDSPAVTAARLAEQQAERLNPAHDAEVFHARDRFLTAQEQMARREATTDERIAGLQRLIEHKQAADPNAGDADLDKMRQREASLRSALSSSDATTPELDTLRGRIEFREQFNANETARLIDAARMLIDQERDKLGAPQVSHDDVDAARRAYEQSKVDAQTRHDADVAQAKADVVKAQADAEAALRQRPEMVDLQRKIDDREGYLKAHLPADDGAANLRTEVEHATARLAEYDRRANPTFSRFGETGLPEAPDYRHPTTGYAGPAFLADGSRNVTTPSGLPLEVIKAIYGAKAVEPQKFDANIKSNVTVTGSIEGKTAVDVTVQPSPLFLATMRRAEMLARVALEGQQSSSSKGDYMGDETGVRPAPVFVPGIGHM